MRWAAGLALLLTLTSGAARALDEREAKILLEQACAMCHAAELVDQQRLTRAQWDKTIAKMQKWGSKVEEEEAALLGEYLAKHRGPDAPRQSPVPVTLAEVEARLAPQKGAAPAGKVDAAALWARDCAPCHGKDARGGLAPALAGRPVLARPAEWAAVVAKGRRRMPTFEDRLSAAEVAALLAWTRAASVEEKR